jgi:hypothetical protein
MPNARDAAVSATQKVLVLGTTGAGKTTQFLTLPGKKFMYLFDPNAISSIQGYDVDYEQFLPDVMNLDVKSLSKEVNKTLKPTMGSKPADTYRNWETHFEAAIASGMFDTYDWIGFDSFTTLADMVMDEVLRINGRSDQWPQQDDYGPQMLTLKNIVRTVTSLGKNIYFTGHMEMKQNELTKKVYNEPIMTGRLKASLPLLFSEIFVLTVDGNKDGNSIYQMQTKPTRDTPLIRTSIKGLEAFEDITIDLSKLIEGQGYGGILNWWSRQPKGAPAK